MSDAHLRDLERSALTGDVTAQAGYIRELLRAGYIDENAIRLAAYLRDEAASSLTSIEEQPEAIFTEIASISVEYRRQLEHVIRNLRNIAWNTIGGRRGASSVRSKNDNFLTYGPEIVIRALIASIDIAINTISNIYSGESNYQINLHAHDNLQRLIEIYIRNTDFEIAYPVIQRIRAMNIRLTHGVYVTGTTTSVRGLNYATLFSGITSLGNTLSLLIEPESEDHETAYLESANETLGFAVSATNLVIYEGGSIDPSGNNWSVIRDAIRNDLVAWLFYDDPLRDFV